MAGEDPLDASRGEPVDPDPPPVEQQLPDDGK
jgi:hypothetical protein